MCGINVVYDPALPAPDREQLVAQMNAEMEYRGPDGEGIYSDGPITLGMRRLSIIDLAGGDQPLFNEDRTLSLVCNGEIYNHVELREALTARGHRFSTGSDCETILHLYEEHGEGCVEHLRGMFAFVLWDHARGRMIAARDRLGIKPLYVARRGRGIALSSELKTLVRSGRASRQLDTDALYQTLRHTYPIDERRTLAVDVDRVPPGTMLVVGEEGVRERRYWSPSFAGASNEISDDDVAETLEDAVRLHLRSDVPVAVLLSAGMDSAALAAIASRCSGNVVALSAGYRGSHGCDERVGAHETARVLGIECRDVEMDAEEFPRLFDQLAPRCDEPPCDLASMAQWALYQRCRELGFKVVLSGIGGDEIFFGYPVWNHRGEWLARRAWVEQDLPPALRSGAQSVEAVAPGVRRALGPLWPGSWTGLEGIGVGSVNQRALRWLGADGGGEASRRSDDIVLGLERRGQPGPDAMYAFLSGAYLPNNGFLLADKIGMGSSVEVRVPLADHVLFEKVTGLRLSRRFDSRQSKPLLRRILRSRLPSEIFERPKLGFSPPGTFIREIVRGHRESVLESPIVRGWLDSGRLAQLMTAYLASTGASSRLGRLGERGRALARDGLGSEEVGWFLYALTAVVRSQEGWTR